MKFSPKSYFLTVDANPNSQSWSGRKMMLEQMGFKFLEDYNPVPDGEGGFTYLGKCFEHRMANILKLTYVREFSEPPPEVAQIYDDSLDLFGLQ